MGKATRRAIIGYSLIGILLLIALSSRSNLVLVGSASFDLFFRPNKIWPIIASSCLALYILFLTKNFLQLKKTWPLLVLFLITYLMSIHTVTISHYTEHVIDAYGPIRIQKLNLYRADSGEKGFSCTETRWLTTFKNYREEKIVIFSGIAPMSLTVAGIAASMPSISLKEECMDIKYP